MNNTYFNYLQKSLNFLGSHPCRSGGRIVGWKNKANTARSDARWTLEVHMRARCVYVYIFVRVSARMLVCVRAEQSERQTAR